MKIKKYFDYFNFIAFNWNLRLAIFTIYHEIRGEKKYDVDTTTINNLKKLEVLSEHKKNAYIYQPVNYYMVEKAFGILKDQPADGNVVDFGSGKGRIIAVAASYGYKNITGVEFAPELCNASWENIKRIRTKYPDSNFEIYCNDAVNYPVKNEDNIFIFFNPFDKKVMLPVTRNILRSLREYPRKIYVVYFNPTESEIFLSAGFHQIYYFKKMSYLDVAIFEMDASANV